MFENGPQSRLAEFRKILLEFFPRIMFFIIGRIIQGGAKKERTPQKDM
jgi:hypothetical protein